MRSWNITSNSKKNWSFLIFILYMLISVSGRFGRESFRTWVVSAGSYPDRPPPSPLQIFQFNETAHNDKFSD